MFMSIISAPRSTFSFAASAITSGSQPANWTTRGPCVPSPSAMRSDRRVFWIIDLLAIISETTMPPPRRCTRRRNGGSVTPVIGARITGSASETLPI